LPCRHPGTKLVMCSLPLFDSSAKSCTVRNYVICCWLEQLGWMLTTPKI
jgi:hypothetical protein